MNAAQLCELIDAVHRHNNAAAWGADEKYLAAKLADVQACIDAMHVVDQSAGADVVLNLLRNSGA